VSIPLSLGSISAKKKKSRKTVVKSARKSKAELDRSKGARNSERKEENNP
jgi:hypothetical protein